MSGYSAVYGTDGFVQDTLTKKTKHAAILTVPLWKLGDVLKALWKDQPVGVAQVFVHVGGHGCWVRIGKDSEIDLAVENFKWQVPVNRIPNAGR